MKLASRASLNLLEDCMLPGTMPPMEPDRE